MLIRLLADIGVAPRCRIRQTLRVTAATAAGVTDSVWEIGEIVDLEDG
jgi:hypothetical protein